MPRSPAERPALPQEPPSTGNVSERLLNTACELFYREGIQAVGIQRIIAKAGVAKASLYANFASKDELVAACLARRSAEWRSAVTERINAKGLNARTKILRLFDLLVEWIEDPDFCGCPFQKAAGELAGLDHRAGDVIKAHRKWLHQLLVDLVRGADARSPVRVAGALIVILDGAAAAALVDAAPDAARHARWAAEKVLDAATGATRKK